MIALLLWQLSTLGHFPVPGIEPMTGHRSYHGVALAELKETQWTHVAICGQVTYVKHEDDGDGHLRISNGTTFVIAEIVPYHPLPLPKVGTMVRVAGISRYDRQHHWWEVHPVEAISIVDHCTAGGS